MNLAEKIHKQALTLSNIRQYFSQTNCLEVLTRSLTKFPSAAPYISSFQINPTDFLRSSPEVAMQTLIWQGSGDIYQIGPAFRKGETGRLHSEEFMLLEWYRTSGWSLHELIDEMIAICKLALPTASVAQHDYFDLFQQHCNIDLNNLQLPELRSIIKEINGILDTNDTISYLDQIINLIIVPKLSPDTLHTISMYPAIDREYARLSQDKSKAFRCEVWYNGVELANGCLEVQNAQEYQSIFAHELQIRQANGANLPNVPQQLLDSIENARADNKNYDFCGAALGLDRLLMLMLNLDNLEKLER